MASAAGVAGLVAVLTLPLAMWVIVGLGLALCIGIAFEITQLLLIRADSVVAFYLLDLDAESFPPDQQKKAGPSSVLGIRLHHRNGRQSEGRISDGAFVMPWFISIPYVTTAEQPGKIAHRLINRVWNRLRPFRSATLPLWRDSIALDDGRRTRVRLRWV